VAIVVACGVSVSDAVAWSPIRMVRAHDPRSLWYADGIKPHQIYFHGGKCHAAASGVTQAFAHHQNIHALSSLPPRRFHLVASTSSLPPRPNISRPKKTLLLTHVLRSMLLSNLPGDPAQTRRRAIQLRLLVCTRTVRR
jgi:hypothetical protein